VVDGAGEEKRIINISYRRIIALVVAMLFAISLIACKRANNPSEQAREKSHQTTEPATTDNRGSAR
jgi:ABC-type uncharacterized transport system auxiliary subunit